MAQDSGRLEIDAKNWKGVVSGVNTNTIVISLVLIVCFGWLGWQWNEQRDIDRNARLNFARQHEITQGLLKSVIESSNGVVVILKDMQKEDSRNRDEIAYILTRTERQRQELNLQMPQSLRARVMR